MKSKYKMILGMLLIAAVFGIVNAVQMIGWVGGASADNVTTYLTAASSSAVIVGPQQNIQVVATSSLRTYLYMQNDNFNTPVYCRADGDKRATNLQGIKLATSTGSFYEFTISKGNTYVGAVRCTALASSTVTITEYRRP